MRERHRPDVGISPRPCGRAPGVGARGSAALAAFVAGLALAGCGSTTDSAGAHPKSATPVAAPSSADPEAAAGPRWIPGDLHMHVAPPDGPGVVLDVAGVARAARGAGLAFVVLTPHLEAGTWKAPRARARWLAAWARMAAAARAEAGVTLLPGAEYSEDGVGHFGVSGVDLTQLAGDDFLGAAAAAGALVVVNHPFAVPTRIPGVPASQADVSYRPWSQAGAAARPDPFAAVEIWNVRLALANLVSRPGGQTAEERALAAADVEARTHRRHLALVGGSDNHSVLALPTTWVRAGGAGADDVEAALAAGATCVGGPEAGSLEGHGDADAEGAWVGVGGSVHARRTVELRFAGRARVFVDGQDRGEHERGFVAETDASPHTFRIVSGASRSGFVYANF